MNAPKAEFIIPKKAKKRGKKFGEYAEEFPPVQTGPAPVYEEYKPDFAMRQAIERAKRDQPELLSLSSTVPAYGDHT